MMLTAQKGDGSNVQHKSRRRPIRRNYNTNLTGILIIDMNWRN